jgi:UTP--glucose-1-phosphate uridylyltransferase
MNDRPLSIMMPPPVRKAVIPAAGYGTRLFPATKAVKKEFFPVVDRDGRAKPVILAIAEEAISAGLESIGIVVQPSDRALFEDFFSTELSGDYRAKLLPKYADELAALQTVGQRVTILTQDTQDGFGHAVYCAQKWVNGEPFLLMLGDHVYRSNRFDSCAHQIVSVYRQLGLGVIGVETAPVDDCEHRGCMTGSWRQPSLLPLLDVTEICEKPTVDYARQHLQVQGLTNEYVLAVSGLYLLPPQIFQYLEDDIHHNRRDRNEFQLTPCLDRLQREHGLLAYLVDGRSFDIGQPQHYQKAMIGYGLV